MKKFINEETVKNAIKSNMRFATEEQVQELTSRILLDAAPMVNMVVRQCIINERRHILEELKQC